MRHFRTSRLFFLSVYFFGLSYLWNGLSVILLPVLILRFVPAAWKNTSLGLLSFFGLALAMVVQPLSGHLSDRTPSRWGRRRPWILAGTLGDFACLTVIALAGNFPMLLVGYGLLQVTSNVAHGPAFGLIPDLVPEGRRGLASGAKSLAEMLGMMAGGVVAGWWVGRGAPEGGLAAIGVVLAACLLLTWVGVGERSSTRQGDAPPRGLLAALRETFPRDWRPMRAYAWFLLSRLLMLTAITPVQGFAQYYVQDFLRVSQPAGATARLMVTTGLSVLVAVYPAGWLADRFGPWRLNVAAGLVASGGIAGMVLAREFWHVLALTGFVGLAMGVFISANWAMAVRLVPQKAGGRYLGLSNLATAGAGMLGRLSGPAIDAVNLVRPGWGYLALFALCSLLMLAGTMTLFRLRRAPQLQ